MSHTTYRSPFDRLRRALDDADFRCLECGFVDQDGGWRAVTTGSAVTYRRSCPGCGAVATRELRLR
ncbi:hypothetical protein OB905_00325 [Halobacteria archaeon AArc-dxtr1]|nr:hypothetical protein [Halobacteria archaeon AArc-dxtr1]